ncbi:sensor histidine kinase N-terminal domain-containing protein [Loktanella sp. TSTF-M6]|uniref:histidine kinase n=1 Tax=Loktanella gaetbuli TaxID=2881335 RepID=A0ABS8BS27_9RHOB|nr:sensor histidine kinase [Loktanella gaetbuli]MCB5198542.1 sensor histidine kinase N-terminal domain-containing protein [Loktanella gaetbuli]
MRRPASIRRRLLLQGIGVAALLALVLYLAVRGVAGAAIQTVQDSVLGTATVVIAEELRGGADGISVDIPYAAFSMLGAVGEDRVFYRILVGDQTVTGYPDLPLPDVVPGLTPAFYTVPYQDAQVRVGAVGRSVLVDGNRVDVTVLLGQTRTAQAVISAQMANRAAGLGLGIFALAAVLALISARSVLAPVHDLALAVGRRGPQDLRPVRRAVPRELVPLVAALNGLIARLRSALDRTESFITEAAHHVRTPLATVRMQTEVALRQATDDATRASLRNVIRAVDNAARSTGQMLDHASVIYRSDQPTQDALDLAVVLRDLVGQMAPTADMRDMAFVLDMPVGPVPLSADRLLLESALRNLLDNALKYGTADTDIEVALTPDGCVTVCDRGRGLGGGGAAALTGRFARGDNVGDVVGSGLGLSIVRDAARACGGTFTISPRPGGGTCATLHLPLR